jgi:sugar phosphate isomerase/epimerase
LLKEYIKLAYNLDAYLVLLGSAIGKIKPNMKRDKCTKLLVECLRESAVYAKDFGVSLAIEPINRYETDFMNTVEEGLKIIELINSDNVHLLIDTFHMNIEEPSIESSIRMARNEVIHVHIADSNRWPPGFGHLDFKSILNSLKEIGYNRYLSIECLPKPDLDTALKEGVDYLKSLRY